MNHLLPLAALALLAPLGAQAAPRSLANDAADAPLGAIPATGAITHGIAIDRTADGFSVHGRDYSADLGRGGVRFTPALGRAAPHNLPLAFRAATLRRGDRVTPLGEGTSPAHTSDTRIEYARNACTERYDVHPRGIEQSFSFERLPDGSGELVVTLELDTELTHVARAGTEVLFTRPGIGGVRVGGVTGIDATGRRVAGELRPRANALELVLPGDFVDEARLPLVLDPMISAEVAVRDTSYHSHSMDLAFLASAHEYLAVWTRWNSASDSDIFGRRLNGSGAPQSLFLVSIETGPGVDQDPRVASLADGAAYLITWDSDGDLHGQGYSPPQGLTNHVVIATEFSTGRGHDLGGSSDPYLPYGISVWGKAHFVDLRVTYLTIQNHVLYAFNPINPLPDARCADLPSISKLGGDENRWVIAYRTGHDTLNDHSRIEAITIDAGGNTTAPQAISWFTHPASAPDVDGDGRSFVIAYQRGEVAGHRIEPGHDSDVYCRALHWNEDLGIATLSDVQPVENDPNDNELEPSVAFAGESAVIGYRDDQGGARHAYVKSVDSFRCLECEPEVPIYTGSEWSTPVLCAKGVAFPGHDAVLVGYEVLDTVSGYADLFSRTFTAEDGETVELLGGCGVGGYAESKCALAGRSVYEMRLRDAAPNTSAFLMVGFTGLYVPCGSCILRVQPVVTYALATDGAGSAAVPFAVPGTAGWHGLTMRQQWVVIPPPGEGECFIADLDFSTPIETTFQ